MYIAYTGAQGTGKTTSAKKKAKELQLEYPDKKVGTVLDVTRDCPLPINQQGTKLSQIWSFAARIKAEIDAMAKYNIVVADRTALDVVAYSFVGGFGDLAFDQFDFFKKHLVQNYDEIIFKKIETNSFNKVDGVRDNDKRFRQQIDNCLWHFYQGLILDTNINFKEE